MNIGILGSGKIVEDLMQTQETLPFEKKYLLSSGRNPEKTQTFSEKYNFDGVYTDYDELLKSDIDTIYVALPNHLHYTFAKKAIEAGKHVIIEKPITSNIYELNDLKHMAAKYNVMLFEAMTIHYHPAYLELKKHITDIGNIKIAALNYSQYSSRYDAFKEGTILPAFDYHKSGGALMDLNVYNIHFLIGLFGKPLAVHYEANIKKGIDTSGILTLDYGTFKAVAIGAKDCKAPLFSSVQGDEGSLQVFTSVNNMSSFCMESNNGASTDFEAGKNMHRMHFEFNEIDRIIRENDTAAMENMLEISTIASEITTQARQDAGIVFDNDKTVYSADDL